MKILPNQSVIITMLIVCIGMIVPQFVSAGYYQDAYNEYKAKNYTQAIVILKEGIEAAPNDEDLSFLLAQTYLKIKDYNNAAVWFKKTIALDPEREAAHYMLGLAYTRQTVDGELKPDWFEASQAFAEALKFDPEKYTYLYNYGHSLLELKKYNQALDPLAKAYATEEGSKDPRTVTFYGIALHKAGDSTKALELFERAMELEPDKYQPMIYLGKLYMESGNYQKAIAVGKKLTALKPDLAMGFTLLGFGQIQEEKYSEAVKTFDKAIELDPQDASAYFYKALSRENLLGPSASSYQELINLYAKAISLSDDSSDEWVYRLGHAYELEAQLDWDRVTRDAAARARCKSNLSKALANYNKIPNHSAAQQAKAVVVDRLQQIETIG